MHSAMLHLFNETFVKFLLFMSSCRSGHAWWVENAKCMPASIVLDVSYLHIHHILHPLQSWACYSCRAVLMWFKQFVDNFTTCFASKHSNHSWIPPSSKFLGWSLINFSGMQNYEGMRECFSDCMSTNLNNPASSTEICKRAKYIESVFGF